MWVISGVWRKPGERKATEERTRTLLPGHEYHIGRTPEYLLGVHYSSISKCHASVKVGVHSETDVVDLASRPTLTLQPQASMVTGKTDANGDPTWKMFTMHLRTADDREIQVPGLDEQTAPSPRSLKAGDQIRLGSGESFGLYQIEWRPVVLKLEISSKAQAEIVKQAASLGIKVVKKDSDLASTHLVIDIVKQLQKPSLLAALADGTPVVASSFVHALAEAAKSLPKPADADPQRETWSPLEFDVDEGWPKEGDHEPKVDVAAEDAGRGSLAWDAARASLFKGLTILGLASETSATIRTVQAVVKRCGGTFVQVDPIKLADDLRGLMRSLLVQHKAAADKAYPAYLRKAGKTIPTAARGSGLVVLMGSGLASDMATAGLSLDDVTVPAANLGLDLAPLKSLGLALYESDISPLLKASRISGASGDGAHSLPSQISASVTSSHGQPDALVSPNVGSSAPRAAGSSPDKVDDTTFDFGDDDVGEISLFDLDAMVSPPSSPPRSLPSVEESLPAASRAPTSTNPFDNWAVDIPAPAPRKRRKAATESPSKIASIPQSAQPSLGNPKPSFVDDSFEEPAPQSERVKSLYESIRAKSRGDDPSQAMQASGSRSPAGGRIDEVSDDGDAFVEGQRKRRRAEQAAADEKRKRARLEADAMDGVEGAATVAGGIQAARSSREASALVASAPGRGAATSGDMPPPPVPAKGKRKAADETDTDFLRAPAKRKRKGQPEDPLDADFNKLKIAKLPGRPTEAQPVEADDATPRLVIEYFTLQPREPRQGRPAPVKVDGAVPNFKKFVSNKGSAKAPGPRRRGPLVMTFCDEFDSNSKATHKTSPDEDMKPIVNDEPSPDGRSALRSQRSTQAGSMSAAGPSFGRRKKLTAADDSDDDDKLVRTTRGSKAVPRKKAVAQLPDDDDETTAAVGERPTARTTATLDESDEDEAPARRPKIRGGRKKLIQADDSDEDAFKGWGVNSRGKRG